MADDHGKPPPLPRTAGVTKQVVVLAWKHALLCRRNLLGSLLELLCPLAFMAVLLVMRHFIERNKYYEQYNLPRGIFNLFTPYNAPPNRQFKSNKIE